MPKIFTFCNQKGGVGKTTSAVNVAAGVALKGFRVLLIDFDPQGNSTSGLGIDRIHLSKTVYDAIIGKEKLFSIVQETTVKNLLLAPANVDLTGAEIELIDAVGREFILKEILTEALSSQGGCQVDFVFIDCPPSLGILTLNALVASQKLLIPLQCEYYALEGLGQLLNTYKLVKDRLNPSLEISGVILTMADFRTNLTTEVIKEVRNYFGEKVFSNIIPRSVKLSEAPSFGKPAILYESSNRGSQSYLKLVEEFIARELRTVPEERKDIEETLSPQNYSNKSLNVSG